ncbi:lipoprotein signal peptidase [Bacteroidales bacterium OttesenSCG-928-I21]|nr:lipoprotein signal peptidase [Bacteroidales bacterium OttesenSCG-928-I21]
MKKKTIISISVILGILLIDQVLKIWVKTHMYLGEEISIIGNKILLHFIENPGMAFGMEFGGEWGKLALSIFRIIAIAALVYYLIKTIKHENTLFVVCLSLIIAGATGNLIDSAFYGMIFGESHWGQIAQIFPEGGGYASFLHGKVVDMFYCPIINTILPEWVPILGGEKFVFFSPVFNVADSAITVAIFMMLIFYKKIFKNTKSKSSLDCETNVEGENK